jgi:hypothetical protein
MSNVEMKIEGEFFDTMTSVPKHISKIHMKWDLRII